MKVLALTDHDTMAGIREAVSADSKFGIRIIPGVEMSIIQGKCLLAFTLSAKRPFNLNNYTMLLNRRHHILSLHTLVNRSAVLFNVASPFK